MPVFLFWAIAFFEGFSTLAVEVIAIRLAVPVVGSSMTLTGVMLGVVLLALSVGYWHGGALSARWNQAQTLRGLMRNLLIAALLYGALAFPLEAAAIEKFLDWSFPLPVAIGAAAALLYLLPIYLASQTVPMLAELTNTDGHAGRASGRVLFFSTLGSVAGGIVTPVWLFPSIGVTNTTYVVSGLLALAALVVAFRGRIATAAKASIAVLAGALAIGTASRLFAANQSNVLYSFDSAYQNISIVESKRDNGRVERVMLMSGGRASGVWADTGATSFAYAHKTIEAIDESGAESVLVIGSAGFSLPRDAAGISRIRVIDAVDVDPAVRPIAEQHFLRARLPSRIRFLPLSARYAVRKLHRDGMRYGFTLMDAYFGRSIPEELATVEFFSGTRKISDRCAMNLIVDRDLESTFSHRALAGFRAAFGDTWIFDATPGDSYFTNLLVTNFPLTGSERWTASAVPYTDDSNSASRDFVAMQWY